MLHLYSHIHIVLENDVYGKLCVRKLHDVNVMLTSALGEGDAEEITGSLRNSRRD